ncbi:hypothetical protein AMS59_04595 [Lysinibacillus sp. FJAT-14745]|uniref:hypothetical protein n=1 Tax=Lysinibacillus sp. FJAT-14745 TaxID=1704289 RepID=UPI0006ABC403|nr:hypothetical protein [Lysinibacillus sp. FJAT-14745]KOP80656.1 hypothetical protein AMS59_04595 [Lysinibacillus sp. FJAT-14745]
MKLEQYQAQAEEVIRDLREQYVFVERTELVEALMKLERSDLLRKGKVESEILENPDESKQYLMSNFSAVVEMSDEEVMQSIMEKILMYLVTSDTGVEAYYDLFN